MRTIYETIIEVPAGTEFESLPSVFVGMSQLLELNDLSLRRMPGTRDFNGRMLVQLQIKPVQEAALVMQLLAAGISGALGQSWTLKAAQEQRATPQADAEGNPVMEPDGEGGERQVIAVNVAMPLSKSYFLDFMPDIDEQGTRPTEATPHQFAGSAPWVMVE